MSTSTAELTLVIRARNLANGAVDSLGTAVDKIKTKAGQLAGAFKTAFAGMGGALSIFASDIAHGEDLQQAAVDAGLFMGATLAANLGEALVAKMAGSAFIAKIGAQVAITGAAAGTGLTAAIAVGMAAAPFVIIGALAALVTALFLDKDLRDQFFRGGQKLVQWIADGMSSADSKLNSHYTPPGQPQGLPVPPGYHPQYKPPPGVHATAKAEGGWVGLNGPELALMGERGPEYVRKAGTGTGDGARGVTIQGVTEKQIIDMVDRGLFFKLQRAAPTLSRS